MSMQRKIVTTLRDARSGKFAEIAVTVSIDSELDGRDDGIVWEFTQAVRDTIRELEPELVIGCKIVHSATYPVSRVPQHLPGRLCSAVRAFFDVLVPRRSACH